MRRRKRHNRFLKFIPLIIIGIVILIGGIYFLFINPVNINSGILLDKKVSGSLVRLKLGYKDKTKWIILKSKEQLPDAIAYNVKLNGMFVKSISPSKVITGKVLLRSTKIVQVNEKKLDLRPDVYYYKLKNKNLVRVSSNNVIVGYSTYKFLTDLNGKVGAVLVESPYIKTVRVGISNYDFSSLNHYSLTFSSDGGLKAVINGNTIEVPGYKYLRADYKDGYINLSIYSRKKDSFYLDSTLGNTNSRVYISSSGGTISIDSLKRSGGYTPSYYGDFELSIANKSIRLINNVGIEDYLKFVVPAEMLPSGGVEGYKVQAIAARTYVLSDMLSGRFAKQGFHVDDTISSQVYNSLPTNYLCERAVSDTAGKVLTYKNAIIDAKYYSTSCGVGAPFNEVWYNANESNKTNSEPYLQFKDYTETGIKDLSNEDTISSFLKDWTIKAYDSNSPYFRWKYDMDIKKLDDTINSNIYSRYLKSPSNFKKKWYFNIYRQANIPKGGIGKIEDIYISKRGKSGNIMSMTIVSETGTYKINKDTNIRSILTPKDTDFEIDRIYGNPIKNPSTLPSGFLVIDRQLNNNKLEGVTIYGGGFGHGAGMSQYGVIGLIRKDKNYIEILKTFYSGVEITDYHNLTY